ncbi:MAG: CPBP family intramembrane metalloprotease, partial [Gammaproteobacteria bacterium]|nr:CPBP family intramembrane metalloprotease [Gammaproteobacteria bacterium]NNL50904.1 CPBP family intramembrane metalloprotease [Woeseiaceae bacterium]
MKVAAPVRTNVIAVLVASTAALIARAWLQLHLQTDGLAKGYASDLSFLIVPPIMMVLLAPVYCSDRTFLFHQFRRSAISAKLIVNAILIGVLLRLAAWSRLVAGASFGIHRSSDPLAVEGPVFGFQCASPAAVALGFVVMAAMVPVIEEVVHRAYVQSGLRHYGSVAAIVLSAGVFAVFHPTSSWLFSFVAGLVFGIQYWQTGSLWP